VIVGGSGEDARFRAFRWTERSGMRSVQQMLDELGVDTAGWMLGAASAVSADGSVIIGNGTNPQGAPEGWIAVLPVNYVPEPNSLILALGPAAMLLGLRRVRAPGGTSDRDYEYARSAHEFIRESYTWPN
jgi:hypothetical protein